jgi:hypothetical protein
MNESGEGEVSEEGFDLPESEGSDIEEQLMTKKEKREQKKYI